MKKKDRKSSVAESTTISTLLGRDTVIEGTLTFKETIRLDGRIKGKLISTDGTVIVGDNAVLDAEMQVGVAIIRGKFTGRIEASQRIELYAPAQVNGDISAPTIAIDSGVHFNGNCQMQTAQAGAIKKPASKPQDPPSKAVPDQKDAKSL